MIYFISGHLDLTMREFLLHYVPAIHKAMQDAHPSFVVGDARGADKMAQAYLKERFDKADVTVYHMLEEARSNAGFPLKGGFKSDKKRDSAMTRDSDGDIAWVRPGHERSGTAQNLRRRLAK